LIALQKSICLIWNVQAGLIYSLLRVGTPTYLERRSCHSDVAQDAGIGMEKWKWHTERHALAATHAIRGEQRVICNGKLRQARPFGLASGPRGEHNQSRIVGRHFAGNGLIQISGGLFELVKRMQLDLSLGRNVIR